MSKPKHMGLDNTDCWVWDCRTHGRRAKKEEGRGEWSWLPWVLS